MHVFLFLCIFVFNVITDLCFKMYVKFWKTVHNRENDRGKKVSTSNDSDTNTVVYYFYVKE